MCSSSHILRCINQTNITTWIPTASSLILPLEKDIIHGWWLSSRMLEGVSPILGANAPHRGLLSKSFWVGCIWSLKNHHASYQDQTFEEKGILCVPLSWRGLKYHPIFRGPFWVQNQWQSTIFVGNIHCANLVVCHACHGHSIPVVYLKEGMGNFTLPKTSV